MRLSQGTPTLPPSYPHTYPVQYYASTCTLILIPLCNYISAVTLGDVFERSALVKIVQIQATGLNPNWDRCGNCADVRAKVSYLGLQLTSSDIDICNRECSFVCSFCSCKNEVNPHWNFNPAERCIGSGATMTYDIYDDDSSEIGTCEFFNSGHDTLKSGSMNLVNFHVPNSQSMTQSTTSNGVTV